MSRRGPQHGMSRTPEYRAWCNLVQRCTNPANPRFADYGGRGISVCTRWRESFPAFLEDMGPRPSASHLIDRIDNDRGYEPGNCRWTTMREQARNKRSNVVLEFEGERVILADLRARFGVSGALWWLRVHVLGWDDVRAATTPPNARQSAAVRAGKARQEPRRAA